MITNSNPFLRNDYYPDQNDIDDLNTRINEVQSDVDLLAISVNEKTEAVNGRLNNLQDDYNESFETEALKANTADFNVLNVNVQATIKDLNAVNTYIENLIVNKPVQDLSLRTPHLENTTSLNGNFYAPNVIGGVFDNIQVENLQNFKAVNIEADEVRANIADFNAVTANTIDLNEVKANIADFNVLNAVNIKADEVKANTVNLNEIKANIADFNVLNVANAKVDEVIANTLNAGNIQVNGVIAELIDLNVLDVWNIYVKNAVNANTVKANTVDLNVLNAVNIEAGEVKANKLIGDFLSAEPISSSAVVGYDENGQLIPIRASYDVSFPESADYLKTDAQGAARKGTSESEVVQSTNLIQAGAVQNMYDVVNANFNNVSNSFNNVSNNFNSVSNSFNSVSNSFNTVNANFKNVKSNVKTINDFIFKGIYLPDYGSFNSHSPVTYASAKTVELYGNAQGGTAIPGVGGMIKFDSSTNTVTFGFSGAACKGIVNASYMFALCTRLNQNILIPSSVEDATQMFYSCSALNQNILIPSSVVNAVRVFVGCSRLNQDVYIYSQVLSNMNLMFMGTKVNKHNVHIPSSVPKDTSNYIYNCLVNNATGVTFAPENIINDLPVDTEQWPPV